MSTSPPVDASGDQALMTAAYTSSRALLLVIGVDGRVLVSNPAMTRATGWSAEELAARPFWDTFVAPEDRAVARADFTRAMSTGAHFTVEGDWVARDGARRRVWMQVDVLLDRDGRPYGESLVGVDVTDQRREQDRLRRHADTDALTGLANRRSALTVLGQALADGGPGAGVLFCDLDGLKATNDRDGHHAGDLLLVEVARRLAATTAPGELVARLGGDEFVVVSPGADRHRLAALAATVQTALEGPTGPPAGPDAPSAADPRSLRVGVSIGSAVGAPGADPDEVLRAADTHMYQVKTARRARARP
ncbi:GGDEF domain-containing protein [Pseudokineococcus marinus]|nr:GGDEF domain-containing protein [Pseudokineococcus marinus]